MEKRERNKRTKRKAIKQKKSIVDFIMSQKEFIMVILGVCTVVYPLINNVYKKAYQISCEKFYEKRKKIEKRYFVKTETIFWCILLAWQ